MPSKPRSVILAGASGLVGGMLLRTLLADPQVSQVHAIARRALAFSHAKLQVHVADFSRLPPLPAADEVYLALGTTIKVAGSQAPFRAVDLNANHAVAVAAQAAGARRAGLVSAAGADAESSVFYSRIKGELEDALKSMDWTALVIARPSLLLGNRADLQQPARYAERIAMPFAKLLAPLLPDAYRPVHARQVASALAMTVPAAEGVLVLGSGQLADIGNNRAAGAFPG